MSLPVYHRTPPSLGRRLAVLFDPSSDSHWPAYRAISQGMQRKREMAEVILFDEKKRENHSVVWADIQTPEALLERWAEFLTPPIFGPSPLFSLTDLLQISGLSRTSRPSTLVRYNPNGLERDTVRLLHDTRHLGRREILWAIMEGAWQGVPVPWRGYDVVWDREYPEGYGEVLFRHSALRERALHAPTRQEYMAWRAAADDLWVGEILDHRMRAEAFALLEEPPQVAEIRDFAIRLDDMIANNGKHPVIPDSREERIEESGWALMEEVSEQPEIPTPPALLHDLKEFHREYGERPLPGLHLTPAITWLTERE